MLQTLKRTARFFWIRTLAILALVVAVVAYVWRLVSRAASRSTVAAKRATIEIQLFKARRAAQDRETNAAQGIDARHTKRLAELDARAFEINEAAKDSRAALATAINRSFGK